MFKVRIKFEIIGLFLLVASLFPFIKLNGQSAVQNVYGRTTTCLNGKWNVLIDPTNIGNWRQVWREPVPQKKTDFFEYSFDGGPILNVPGDFNTQMAELTYMEGTVWYRKRFSHQPDPDSRLFIHFGGVNYIANVYLNGEYLGSHEGGFTPFQFEITGKVTDGENTIVVGANNERRRDGIPGLGYDWFNYGGITRDVMLFETPGSFIEDYFIQLKKGSMDQIAGWVKIDGQDPSQRVTVSIPELGVESSVQSGIGGIAEINFQADLELWSPANPRLYRVIIAGETDTVTDLIGFRSIEARGSEIFLNGEKIFIKGVNIHEEAPLRGAKAFAKEDAAMLLTWAKELGCNLVRLSHYPHNEHMVKMAEEMGLMVWSELPVYQHIEFQAPGVQEKIELMLREMVKRDRNRCAVITWCLSNETYHFTPMRDEAHLKLLDLARSLDDTRLFSVVINTQGYNDNTFNVWDPLYKHFDFIALNEYIGWYVPWQGPPQRNQVETRVR
jgi:beta-glucuronidase